jgi:hypothetical protein
MERCETCPHWNRESEMVNLSYGDPVPELEAWGECRMGQGEDGKPAVIETLVFAMDMSSFQAHLATHKTFGCVLHPGNSK